MKFGVDIQLEGNTSGDTIDESFIFIKGSFGQILIGSENSAGYKMSYGAPDSTWIGVNSGSTSQFMPWATGFRTIRETSFLEVDGNNDAQRLTYFTPRFSGFQLGASYARDANQGGGQADLDTELGNIFDVGANYVNTLGGVDVALAGRYGTADAAAGDDPTVYAIGLNLGFAGFTVGGSYAGQDGGQAVNEGNFWDVGASYTTGPWAASLTYSQSDGDDGTENMRIIGGASYKLGPGVKAGAYAGYAENDRVGRNAAGDITTPSGEGFYVGTGVKLNF